MHMERLTQEHDDNFFSIMNNISVSFRSQNYGLPWQPLHGHRKRAHSHDSVNLCYSLKVSHNMKETFVLQFSFLLKLQLSGLEKRQVSHWVSEPTEAFFIQINSVHFAYFILFKYTLDWTMKGQDEWECRLAASRVATSSTLFLCSKISHLISCLLSNEPINESLLMVEGSVLSKSPQTVKLSFSLSLCFLLYFFPSLESMGSTLTFSCVHLISVCARM